MSNSTRVVMVNYNAGDALLRSVAAVLATREPLHLVVADNASKDDSCGKLRNLYGRNQRLEILENGQNLGFARAVNACASNAPEPYLLILNPDCELFPDTLAALRTALEQDPQAALAAPRIVDRQDRTLRGSLRTFPEPWKALTTASGLWRLARWLPVFSGIEPGHSALPTETCRAEAVSGACMLVRRDVFNELGGLDEGYGLHFEDLDLMYRLRQVNRCCLFVPGSRAFHQPGTSSRSRPWWVHRQKHLGMQRFFRKHFAARYSRPEQYLFVCGNWLHYLLTLPLVLLRR
jgi:GT2 family glycosyltransferase